VKAAKLEQCQDVDFVLASDICRLLIPPHFGLSLGKSNNKELHMNWDAIGATAEMLGALAVIISLLYLASQVRQNTVASRISRYDSYVHTVSDMRGSILQNDTLSRVWVVGLRDPSVLDEVESVQLRLLFYNAVQTMESLHLQLMQSGLDKEIWSRQLPMISRVLGSPGGREWWGSYKAEFDRSFIAAVDETLS
jgi:hypothetical protein